MGAPKKSHPIRTALLVIVGVLGGGLVVVGIIGAAVGTDDAKAPTSGTTLPNVVTTPDNGPTPDSVITPTNRPTAPEGTGCDLNSSPEEYTDCLDRFVNGTTTTPKPTKAAPKLTAGQEQAIESAESYIESGDFSRKSLIAQLKYEEFSTADATFAVDHITVNWTAEADDAAASYLESGSFSRGSLTAQLLYEGFTKAQAAHGVKSVGL